MRLLLLRADDVPLDVIGTLGQSVVDVVGEKRSTWRRWNLTAERPADDVYRFASTTDREAIVGTGRRRRRSRLPAADLRPSSHRARPCSADARTGPAAFRPKHSTVFSSETLLTAEDRLLERARTTTGPTVLLATVEKIAARPDRKRTHR